MFKFVDVKVAAARAAQKSRLKSVEGEHKDAEASRSGSKSTKTEDQNMFIERLIGGSLSPRESVHLLSLAQPSDERSRGRGDLVGRLYQVMEG